MQYPLFVIAIVSVTLGLPGALTAWGEANADHLVEVLGLEKATTEVTALALVQVITEFPEWKVHEDILLDYAEERVGWNALRPLVTAWYAENFTAKELDELIRFHSTPTGKKWVAISPVLALRMEKWVRERFLADLDVLELRMKNRELERLMEAAVFFDGLPAGREPGE